MCYIGLRNCFSIFHLQLFSLYFLNTYLFRNIGLKVLHGCLTDRTSSPPGLFIDGFVLVLYYSIIFRLTENESIINNYYLSLAKQSQHIITIRLFYKENKYKHNSFLIQSATLCLYLDLKLQLLTQLTIVSQQSYSCI